MIKGIQSEGRSFTNITKMFTAVQEKVFITEKVFAHESGKLVVLVALEKGDPEKTSKILFYTVKSNETLYEPLEIKSNIKCIEFLDCFFNTSPDIKSMDPKLQEQYYSMLLGSRNGDLYLVSFLNSDPHYVKCMKIYNFVKASNEGNAELCSIKKIKAFAPRISSKKYYK